MNSNVDCTVFEARGWRVGGGGVFPYIGHIGMCRPHRIGFLRHFGLKTGIHLAHFGLELGMVFKGTTIYSFNS